MRPEDREMVDRIRGELDSGYAVDSCVDEDDLRHLLDLLDDEGGRQPVADGGGDAA